MGFNHYARHILNHIFVRAWHITCPLTLLLVVYMLVRSLPSFSKSILLISSASMQGFGMTALLFILNKNMIALKDASLLEELKKYLKETIPTRGGKFEIASMSCATMMCTAGPLTAKVKMQGITEERLNVIEEAIESVRQQSAANKAELVDSISSNKSEVTVKLNAVNDALDNLTGKLKATVIGDYRWQLFSVLMILFGLLLSSFQ